MSRSSLLFRRLFGFISITILSVLLGIAFASVRSFDPYAKHSHFKSYPFKTFPPHFSHKNILNHFAKYNQNGDVVGSLNGELNISQTGAAAYSIPIDVPPGTSGLTPELSITYNSQQGNGTLGMGFSLHGLTNISRVASNKTENGKIHGVDYTSEDRFSLDGEQLVAINGDYGADGTEYRSFIDTASKIISYGKKGTGPEKFKVWTKGGEIAEYGFTADSEVLAQGKETVDQWAVNKISDSDGNYIQITYDADPNDGIALPKEIDYTGNDKAGLKPYNKIQFFYENRPDEMTHYRAGSKIELKTRLNEIKIFTTDANGQQKLVYDYHLTYEESPSTFRSRLISIQKFDGAGICLPATKFNWSNKQAGWTKVANEIPNDIFYISQSGIRQRGMLVDLMGHGLPDFVTSYQENNPNQSDNEIYLNKITSWQQDENYKLPDYLYAHLNIPQSADLGYFNDVNGNGLPDYVESYKIINSKESRSVWLNSGNGWVKADYSIPDYLTDASQDSQSPITRGEFIDLNADGLSDVVFSFDDHGTITNTAWLNDQHGWDEDTNFHLPYPMYAAETFGSIQRGYFTDVNGDGLEDYVTAYRGHGGDHTEEVWFNKGDHWEKAAYDFPGDLVYRGLDIALQNRGTLVDLNGDGLPDVIFSYEGYNKDYLTQAWINTGNGWIEDPNYQIPKDLPMLYVDQHEGAEKRGYFVDLTGNGLPDYVYSYNDREGNEQKEVLLNTGSGWKKSSLDFPIFIYDGGYIKGQFVDINGNGLMDFVQAYTGWSTGDQSHSIYQNNGPMPDYLTTITNGLDEKTTITYKPLTDSSVYTKENTAKYPNQDIQNATYVVAQTSSATDSNISSQGNKNADGEHVTSYHYTGAKINHLGLGSLGFHLVTKTDETSGITETTTYNQDINHHYVEEPEHSEIHVKDGTLISSTDTTWDEKVFGDGSLNHTYYLLYTPKVVKKSYTLNATLVTTTTTDTAIDDYANPTEVIETSEANGEKFKTVTENHYNNHTDSWHIGELTSATVTVSSPNQSSISRTSSFEYDPVSGMLTKTIEEPEDENEALTTSYTLDDFGNTIETTISGKGINPRTTSVQYDPEGRFVISEKNTLGQTTYQTTDPGLGEVTQTTDLNQLKTNYHYDGFGRVMEVDNPDGTKETTRYDWSNPSTSPMASVYSVTTNEIRHQGHGPVTTKYFDSLDREVAASTEGFNGTLIWTKSIYDDLGRLVLKTLPYYEGQKEYSVTSEYDPLGRVIKVTQPDGKVVTTQYDGLTTIVTNPLGQKQTTIKNARGDTEETIDNLGNETHFTYDPYGNLLTVQDSKGNTSTITYDKFGKRKIAINDPDKGKWSYIYNVFGELKSETDSLGHTTTIDYDDLGRMIQRTDPAGTSTWEYGTDPAKHDVGQLVHVSGVANASGGKANGNDLIRAAQDNLVSYDRSYTYNDLALPSMVTTELNGEKYSESITYDTDSRPSIEINSLDNVQVENVYNDLGYVSQIKNAKTDHLFYQVNAMDASGHVISELHGNQLITTRTYDPETGFLTDIETKPSEGLKLQRQMFPGTKKPIHQQTIHSDTVNQSLHYTYDELGNLKKRVDDVNNRTETFDYDQLNRLTTWNDNQNNISSSIQRRGSSHNILTVHTYTYDALGNMTSNSDVGTYHYGDVAGPHAVTSITDGHLPSTFKYDLNGNQTEGTINGVTRTISYTSFDKPKQITQGNTQVDFYYNADRSRFERMDQVDGKTTSTLYLGDLEKITYQDGDNVTTEIKHYIGPNTLYDTEPDGHAYEYEMLKDNLGSVVEITNDEGANIQGFHYAPFGLQTQISGLTPKHPYTHSGFTGQEEVESVNLIHMNGRLYDPVIGRFLSADPFIQDPENSQSLNRYSYCQNNPLAFTDPSGYFLDSIGDFFSDLWDGMTDLLSNQYVSMGIGLALSVISMNPMFGLSQLEMSLLVTTAYKGAVTAITGGDMQAVLQAVAMNMFSTLTWGATGSGLEAAGWKSGTGHWFGRGVVHGVVGGGLSEAQGGDFQDGFLAAATSEMVGDHFGPLTKDNYDTAEIGKRTAAAAIIGGTAAAITGGDFVNGAQTAAYAQLYNGFLHKILAGMANRIEHNVEEFGNTCSGNSDAQVKKCGELMVQGIMPEEGAIETAGKDILVTEGGKDLLKSVLNEAKYVGGRLETDLGNGAKLVFRKDFGEAAHSIPPDFMEAVDHYNIEIHNPIIGRPGRYEITPGLHIVVDSSGQLLKVLGR